MDIRAWRVVREKYAAAPFDPFDGSGAKSIGGRWNSPGVSVVYSSWSVSLAVLETLVHSRELATLKERVMASLTATDADLRDPPPELTVRGVPLADTRAFGDAWIAAKSSPVLRVPSVVIPREFNYLLNPEHPDFPRIRATATAWEPLPIDPRLLEIK